MRSSTTPNCNSWEKRIRFWMPECEGDKSLRTWTYLAHFSDGVVKHSAGVIRPFSNQLHLPCSGGQTQLSRVQVHHLFGDLHENGLARAPPVDWRTR